MADIQPVFENVISGTVSLGFELWADLGTIPTGKRAWFGFATYGADDKDYTFETRTNKATKSAGTTADTTLHDFAGATQGDSVDRDFYQYGNILMQSVVSTGVEKMWLRIKSKSTNSGNASYIIYYTEY